MSFTTKGKVVELFEDQQKTQDEQDEDGLQACKNFRDGSAFFSPPIQRQNWEDTQILPHVNWGDLFFDLFYVAAAFNLATLIKSDPSFKGLCYFFALFGPVFTIFWQTKMMYDARYALPNDTIHGIITVLQLCALATSILHIRPLEYMSRGADHPEMFLYCLGIVLGNLINMLLHFEIKFIWVVGQVAATRAALRELKFEAYSCILNCGALIYAAVLFYGKGGTSQQEYHGPVIILAIALFSKPLILTIIFRFYFSPDRNFKTSTVPMNIEFSIHRYGEWTMLMLGESILSLLIVNDVSSNYEQEYYFTFYLGIVSVTLLQFLYFKSQPHHPDHHALRRSRYSGIVFVTFIQFYSAALILVGVSYKMLLTEYTTKYADASYGDNRNLADSTGSANTKEESNERRQTIANLFSFSLAGVFIFLDILSLNHSGFEKATKRCHCTESGSFRFKGIALVLVTRILIVSFLATLSFYVTDPEYVALIGFVTIVMQVMVRFLGRTYFPEGEVHKKGEGEV